MFSLYNAVFQYFELIWAEILSNFRDRKFHQKVKGLTHGFDNFSTHLKLSK